MREQTEELKQKQVRCFFATPFHVCRLGRQSSRHTLSRFWSITLATPRQGSLQSRRPDCLRNCKGKAKRLREEAEKALASEEIGTTKVF